MDKTNKFSPEVRERAVRMVQERRGGYPSLWAAVESIAPKIGCVPQTLLEWVKRAEVDAGARPGTTTPEMQRIKELDREVKELRRTNEILRTAPDCSAPCPLDRVNRQFSAGRPNQLWGSDFTYVSTWRGWLYVAFVVDIFARQPEGNEALVHHSDRGSQYLQHSIHRAAGRGRHRAFRRQQGRQLRQRLG